MAYTVEKLLSDAASLVSRLKEHDCTADILISQTQTLHKRIDSMKEVITLTLSPPINPFSAGTAFMLMQTGWIQASHRETRRLA